VVKADLKIAILGIKTPAFGSRRGTNGSKLAGFSLFSQFVPAKSQ
jgi:hypothetical protein